MGEPGPMTTHPSKGTQHAAKRSRESSFDGVNKRRSYSDIVHDDVRRAPSRDGRGYRMDSSGPMELTRRRDTPMERRDNDRERRPERSAEMQDDWTCPECLSVNHIRRVHCEVCDVPRPRGRAETRHCNEEELDEFGRKKGSSAKPAGPRWPPPFDRRSSTYVFDVRSGMFYHASSQFFFDPKTKLYYGNKEQKYYVHCKDEHPHFREFESQTTDTEKVEQETKAGQKPLIAISLKTKVLASSEKTCEKTKKVEVPVTQAVSRVKKQHASNIDRWSERGREVAGKGPVVRTKAGQPVCLLCKRKFTDLQKLERHEDLSEMHKKNESIYGKQVKNIEETAAAAYARDRALERRVLHGADSDLTVGGLLHNLSGPNVADAAVDPQEILDESNIGNQMLQKLGWISGTNLGRTSRTAVSDGSLRKDWERIERLAKQGNK